MTVLYRSPAHNRVQTVGPYSRVLGPVAVGVVPADLIVQDATLAVAADNVTLQLSGVGIWEQIAPIGSLDPDDPNPNSNFGYQAVALAGNGNVFAHLDHTGLYRSTDHGDSWTKFNADAELDSGSAWTLRVDPFDDDIMWSTSGFGGGGPLKSTDGGANWTKMPAGSPTVVDDVYCIALDPYLADHLLVTWHSDWSGQGSSGVSESFNGGSTWTHHNAPTDDWGHGHAVFFLSDSDTWLVGTQDDGFYRTTDGGDNWTQVITEVMTHGATDCLTTVGSDLFLACEHHIRHSNDDGATWTDITGALSTGVYYSAVATDGVNLFTAGSFPITPDYSAAAGPVYTRLVSGGSWTSMDDSPDVTFEGNSNGPRMVAYGDGYVYTANYMAGVWRLVAEPVETDLVVADAASTLTADNITLTQVHTLAVADAAHALTTDAVVLTQVHILVVADAALAVTADNQSLTQVHALTVADAAITVTADNVALTASTTLAVDDAAHAVTADNLTLTQVHALAVDDATHAHSADNIALTQVHQLVVADATHAVSADNIVLAEGPTLEVANAASAVTADNITLTQVHQLVVADALHVHTADNITLTQTHVLTVADAAHSHTADNLTLTGGSVLTVNDAAHSQTADNVVLTQVHVLTVNDCVHVHTADGLALTQVHQLVVNRAAHSHTADNVVISDGSPVDFNLSAQLFGWTPAVIDGYRPHIIVGHRQPSTRTGSTP